MRKVIVQEFVSADGFAADANGSVSFVPASAAGDAGFGKRQIALMDSVDAILLGRVTYEMFAGYWPNVGDDAEDKRFADKINAMEKVVFSGTLDRAPWGNFAPATIVHADASRDIAIRRNGAGKDMVLWGSLSLARSLMRDGLVDEIQLVVCPVILGSGKPLFSDEVSSLKLKLARAETFERGMALLTYDCAR